VYFCAKVKYINFCFILARIVLQSLKKVCLIGREGLLKLFSADFSFEEVDEGLFYFWKRSSLAVSMKEDGKRAQQPIYNNHNYYLINYKPFLGQHISFHHIVPFL